MALQERTIRSDLFKHFLAQIKSNMSISGVKVTNAFVADETKLPQIVIAIPVVQKNRTKFGTGTKAYGFPIDIEISVYTKSAKDLSLILDDLQYVLYTFCLSEDIRDIQIGASNDLYFENEGINVHAQTLPLTLMIGDIE